MFKESIIGSDLDFGIQLTKPLNYLPWGSSLAIAFIQFIDPALVIDLSCAEPFALSPLLCR